MGRRGGHGDCLQVMRAALYPPNLRFVRCERPPHIVTDVAASSTSRDDGTPSLYYVKEKLGAQLFFSPILDDSASAAVLYVVHADLS